MIETGKLLPSHMEKIRERMTRVSTMLTSSLNTCYSGYKAGQILYRLSGMT